MAQLKIYLLSHSIAWTKVLYDKISNNFLSSFSYDYVFGQKLMFQSLALRQSSEKRLMLKKSAFKLFTVANLSYQLSW